MNVDLPMLWSTTDMEGSTSVKKGRKDPNSVKCSQSFGNTLGFLDESISIYIYIYSFI